MAISQAIALSTGAGVRTWNKTDGTLQQTIASCGAVNTMTAAVPSDVSTDDYLLYVVKEYDNRTISAFPNANWTAIINTSAQTRPMNAAFGLCNGINNTASTNLTWTFSSAFGTGAQALLIPIRNVLSTFGIVASAKATTSTAPTITTSAAPNNLVFYIFSSIATAATVTAPPAGYTTLYNHTITTPYACTIYIAYKYLGASQATGTAACTYTGGANPESFHISFGTKN